MLPLWIVWAGMTSTVFICGAVALFMPITVSPSVDMTKAPLLIGAFAMISAVFVVGSFILRSRLCSADALRRAFARHFDGRTSIDPTIDESKDASSMGSSPLEQVAAKTLFPGYVASWAAAEAAAIHGFALSHIFGDAKLFLYFAIPALISLIAGRPGSKMIQTEIARLQSGASTTL